MITSETPDPLPNDAEPNDDFDHALTASLNTEVTGHLGYLGPQSVIEKQDYWQVSLPTDGTLHLDIATGTLLNLNQNDSVGASGGVMVYDADRNTVFYSVTQGQNTTNTHSIPKLKAGVYYVRLVVIGTASAPLTLTVLPLPTLTLQRLAPNQVVITWPADYADFALLTANAVNPSAAWEAATPAPTANGNFFSVTNLVEQTPRYYRLKHATVTH